LIYKERVLHRQKAVRVFCSLSAFA
jgi:hypothetical protein